MASPTFAIAPKLNYFISRSGANVEWGLWVAEILTELGHDYTLQDHHFPLGAGVMHEINAGLERSDHVIALYSEPYSKSDYCMAEFEAAYNLDPRGKKRRLLIVRLDDCAIPQIASQLVRLDLRDRSPRSRRQLEARLKGERPCYRDEQVRTFTGNLPIVDPHLFGREKELARLDAAWADPEANVVAVVAGGGTGKTALVDKWFRGHIQEATVFGWSFYSQGSTEDRQTSSDPFFNEVTRFFDVKIDGNLSVFAKAEALARRMREERVLLILDGLEPMQAPDGTLRDNAIKALLSELRTRNAGLVVCSSRLPLVDVPSDDHHSIAIDLENLDPEAGGKYLAFLGVQGPPAELEAASDEFDNHALAVTLLGTYLVDYMDGDVRRRTDIPSLPLDAESKVGAHARRMMESYARMFAGKPERAVLTALGYFDRPAEPEALRLVLPKMTDIEFRGALKRLKVARLILSADPKLPIDCHPLVREHFSAESTEEGHGRLYEHYCNQAPHRPDTEPEMVPLFRAVYHGCRGAKHQRALDDVYHDRILRGSEAYLNYKLGVYGTDLSLLANFFVRLWTEPHPSLSVEDQAWVINCAAFALRALGRLADAVEPMRAAAEGAVRESDWERAGVGYSNLSGLQLTIGDIPAAIASARQSVDYADRSADAFQRMGKRTTLASALQATGEFAEATRFFQEAERLQAEWQPQYPLLYSAQGYQYCDLLLFQGQATEVQRRATQTLEWATQHLGILAIGLDHLSLGRATGDRAHLDQAVDYFRRAGRLDYLPLGLLVRGTQSDLDEVHTLATRCGMKLHLTDYHLAQARLHLTNGNPEAARPHIGEAAKLIEQTGYHRRDRELAELRQRVP